MAVYRSIHKFEASRPLPGHQGAEIFWVLPNSVLSGVDVPPLGFDELPTSAHRVRFQYDGECCTATLHEFFGVGKCYPEPDKSE
jgi:hypothetical protein